MHLFEPTACNNVLAAKQRHFLSVQSVFLSAVAQDITQVHIFLPPTDCVLIYSDLIMAAAPSTASFSSSTKHPRFAKISEADIKRQKMEMDASTVVMMLVDLTQRMQQASSHLREAYMTLLGPGDHMSAAEKAWIKRCWLHTMPCAALFLAGLPHVPDEEFPDSKTAAHMARVLASFPLQSPLHLRSIYAPRPFGNDKDRYTTDDVVAAYFGGVAPTLTLRLLPASIPPGFTLPALTVPGFSTVDEHGNMCATTLTEDDKEQQP